MLLNIKLIFLFLLCWWSSVSAESLNVAVASNFTQPMRQLIAEFEDSVVGLDKSQEHRINLISGSSGKLFAQIVNGAPYDLFFSADQEKVERLIRLDLAKLDSRLTYANGRLVMWTKNAKTKITEKNLSLERFKKIALANAKLAPYGKAAESVLHKLNLEASVREKLVYGENINQTFQFVNSENAQAGFVALAQIVKLPEAEQGSYWLVPEHYHQPIAQDAIILRRAQSKAKAEKFLQFIQSQNAQKIIKAYGYRLAKEPCDVE